MTSERSTMIRHILPRNRTLDDERRKFLKVGAAGSALLLAGRWLAPTAAAASGPSYRQLLALDAVILGRIARVILDGALPEDPAQRESAVAEIVDGVDATIDAEPRSVRNEIRELLDLLGSSATRSLVAGVWKPWNEASDDSIRQFLAGWRDSRFDLLRSAYIGLNNLIGASWYGNPRSWPRIGYAGPPKLA
jgi:hypothetical protein